MNLYWGTHQQNMADMHRHGRTLEGERHPMAKLTEPKVRDIMARWRAGEGPVSLAKEAGVKLGTIEDIVYGRSWRHLHAQSD